MRTSCQIIAIALAAALLGGCAASSGQNSLLPQTTNQGYASEAPQAGLGQLQMQTAATGSAYHLWASLTPTFNMGTLSFTIRGEMCQGRRISVMPTAYRVLDSTLQYRSMGSTYRFTGGCAIDGLQFYVIATHVMLRDTVLPVGYAQRVLGPSVAAANKTFRLGGCKFYLNPGTNYFYLATL